MKPANFPARRAARQIAADARADGATGTRATHPKVILVAEKYHRGEKSKKRRSPV